MHTNDKSDPAAMSSRKARDRGKRGRPLGDTTPKTALAQRLQILMHGPNISATANICRCARETARRYLTGNNEPRSEVLTRLIEETECDATWLLSGKGEPYPYRGGELADGSHDYNVPLIGHATGDDTAGMIVEWEQGPERLSIPPAVGYVQIHGNSMAPIVRDGQYVLVDRNPRSTRDGDLVVVETNDGQTYLKRCYDEGEEIVLISANPVQPQQPIRLQKTAVKQILVVRGVWYG